MSKALSDPRERMLSAVQLASSGLSEILMTISLVTMILIYDDENHPPCFRRVLRQRNPTAETEAMNQRPPEVDDPALGLTRSSRILMSVFIVFHVQKYSTMNVGDHSAAWQHSPAPKAMPTT
ncbi:hypothetical protein ACVDG5_034475 [Mesorhizobium sp. ORM6]